METNIKEKLNMFILAYGDKGKFTKISNDLYGFVGQDNKILFIDLIHNKVLDKAYNLDYLGKNILLLSNIERNLTTTSIVLNRKTFKTKVSSSYKLNIENEIIYEQGKLSLTKTNESESMRFFNLNGEKIGEIQVKNIEELTVELLDDQKHYLVAYKNLMSQYKSYKLITYNKKKNNIEIKWESDELYSIDKIGYGLYMFSELNDFSKIYVYDLINKRIVSEQP